LGNLNESPAPSLPTEPALWRPVRSDVVPTRVLTGLSTIPRKVATATGVHASRPALSVPERGSQSWQRSRPASRTAQCAAIACARSKPARHRRGGLPPFSQETSHFETCKPSHGSGRVFFLTKKIFKVGVCAHELCVIIDALVYSTMGKHAGQQTPRLYVPRDDDRGIGRAGRRIHAQRPRRPPPPGVQLPIALDVPSAAPRPGREPQHAGRGHGRRRTAPQQHGARRRGAGRVGGECSGAQDAAGGEGRDHSPSSFRGHKPQGETEESK
jgi:hypothetical protein